MDHLPRLCATSSSSVRGLLTAMGPEYLIVGSQGPVIWIVHSALCVRLYPDTIRSYVRYVRLSSTCINAPTGGAGPPAEVSWRSKVDVSIAWTASCPSTRLRPRADLVKDHLQLGQPNERSGDRRNTTLQLPIPTFASQLDGSVRSFCRPFLRNQRRRLGSRLFDQCVLEPLISEVRKLSEDQLGRLSIRVRGG